MILILSIDDDQCTNEVIDWLSHLNKSFIRINYTDECKIDRISLDNESNDIIIKTNNQEINLNNITSYWYRRGDFTIKISKPKIEKNFHFVQEVNNNLHDELKSLNHYLHFFLKTKKSLGSFFDNKKNKLENIFFAKSFGLRTPKTLITSSKKNIEDFYNSEQNIITKAISDTFYFSILDEGCIQSYTNTVSKEDIELYDSNIFPSKFQSNINKLYELRIFYLNGDFFSMAIFSQTNSKTKTDFRNYDIKRPNRCTPHILPEEIKKKLKLFMNQKGYKTGSIDMIVSKDKEYVFLEVNPIGQFGMTSYPCNYLLHKKIAEYL